MLAGLRRRLLSSAPVGKPVRRIQDVLTLELGGRSVPVRRLRDARCRRMRLVVDERGPRLSMPLRASQASGEAFIREHADWVLAQLDKLGQGLPGDGPALAIGTTTELPLLGQSLPLVWRPGRHTHVTLEDGSLVFHHSARAGQAALARALGDFYQAQLRARIAPEVARWLPGLPRAPRRVVIKPLSSLWGSMAQDGTMRLDLSLVLAPPAALQYVVVHELCHLLQANHSPAFWAEVQQRLPDWQAQRDWLGREGRRIKYRLRQLVAVG